MFPGIVWAAGCVGSVCCLPGPLFFPSRQHITLLWDISSLLLPVGGKPTLTTLCSVLCCSLIFLLIWYLLWPLNLTRMAPLWSHMVPRSRCHCSLVEMGLYGKEGGGTAAIFYFCTLLQILEPLRVWEIPFLLCLPILSDIVLFLDTTFVPGPLNLMRVLKETGHNLICCLLSITGVHDALLKISCSTHWLLCCHRVQNRKSSSSAFIRAFIANLTCHFSNWKQQAFISLLASPFCKTATRNKTNMAFWEYGKSEGLLHEDL